MLPETIYWLDKLGESYNGDAGQIINRQSGLPMLEHARSIGPAKCFDDMLDGISGARNRVMAERVTADCLAHRKEVEEKIAALLGLNG